MESQKPSISPLRQRMIDDMRMRKFGEKTQLDYVRTVRKFAQQLGRAPHPVAASRSSATSRGYRDWATMASPIRIADFAGARPGSL